MSPAGGVGINLAIQDAVATANLLAEKLRTGPVSVDDCAKCRRAANGRRGSFRQCRFSFIVVWLPVVSLIQTVVAIRFRC